VPYGWETIKAIQKSKLSLWTDLSERSNYWYSFGIVLSLILLYRNKENIMFILRLLIRNAI
jgi:hypothetical protein